MSFRSFQRKTSVLPDGTLDLENHQFVLGRTDMEMGEFSKAKTSSF